MLRKTYEVLQVFGEFDFQFIRNDLVIFDIVDNELRFRNHRKRSQKCDCMTFPIWDLDGIGKNHITTANDLV